jgi:hypothetical protein
LHCVCKSKLFYLLSGLVIRKTLVAGSVHYGVFCNKPVLTKGTKFGPFKGRVINTSEIKANDDNSLMWEVSVLGCYTFIFETTRPLFITILIRSLMEKAEKLRLLTLSNHNFTNILAKLEYFVDKIFFFFFLTLISFYSWISAFHTRLNIHTRWVNISSNVRNMYKWIKKTLSYQLWFCFKFLAVLFD